MAYNIKENREEEKKIPTEREKQGESNTHHTSV